jgi:flagellin
MSELDVSGTIDGLTRLLTETAIPNLNALETNLKHFSAEAEARRSAILARLDDVEADLDPLLAAVDQQVTQAEVRVAALSDQIDQIVGAAAYNGTNLASGSASISVLTTDQSGGAAGNFVVASNLATAVTSNTVGQKLVSSTATMGTTVTGLDNADTLAFTQTVGGSTNVYTIDLDTADTIDEFVAKVNAATDGAIRASFDSATGQVVYSSSATFTVNFAEAAGTAVDAANTQFLEGTGTAQDLADPNLTTTQLGVADDYGGAISSSTSSTTVSGGDFGRTALGVGSLDISGATGTGASNAITAIDTALNTLRSSLSSLGSQSKALDVQSTFLGALSDTLKSSVGNLVDADLAEESARLQSLQVKQQLGAQALGGLGAAGDELELHAVGLQEPLQIARSVVTT